MTYAKDVGQIITPPWTNQTCKPTETSCLSVVLIVLLLCQIIEVPNNCLQYGRTKGNGS